MRMLSLAWKSFDREKSKKKCARAPEHGEDVVARELLAQVVDEDVLDAGRLRLLPRRLQLLALRMHMQRWTISSVPLTHQQHLRACPVRRRACELYELSARSHSLHACKQVQGPRESRQWVHVHQQPARMGVPCMAGCMQRAAAGDLWGDESMQPH